MTTSTDKTPTLRAGPAPHWSSPLRRRHFNIAIVVGLLPAIGASLWLFGWAALWRLGFAAGAAILVEALSQKAMRQPERYPDLSALGQGLLLALLLPPTVPWWLLTLGVVAMIVLGKQLFGGVGGYPLNPVLVGWAVLLLSWGNRIHPAGEAGLLGTAWLPSIWIGGVVLMVLGHVKWQAPLGMLVGTIIAAFALNAAYPEVLPPYEQLMTGSVVLGAFFLATDTTSGPANAMPRLLFGIGAGALVVVLRHWGIWPEPVPFALLLMSLATPLLDRIRPKPLARKAVRHA